MAALMTLMSSIFDLVLNCRRFCCFMGTRTNKVKVGHTDHHGLACRKATAPMSSCPQEMMAVRGKSVAVEWLLPLMSDTL